MGSSYPYSFFQSFSKYQKLENVFGLKINLNSSNIPQVLELFI